ncbi:MAG: hypothetical protein IPG86_04500 [Chitinophagaceae bacterium]|nr:hypothetical protein [Chitinophagaceae bacterium]
MFDIKAMMAKEVGKGVEVFLVMDACRSNELPGGAEGQGFFNSAVSEQKVGKLSCWPPGPDKNPVRMPVSVLVMDCLPGTWSTE